MVRSEGRLELSVAGGGAPKGVVFVELFAAPSSILWQNHAAMTRAAAIEPLAGVLREGAIQVRVPPAGVVTRADGGRLDEAPPSVALCQELLVREGLLLLGSLPGRVQGNANPIPARRALASSVI